MKIKSKISQQMPLENTSSYFSDSKGDHMAHNDLYSLYAHMKSERNWRESEDLPIGSIHAAGFERT